MFGDVQHTIRDAQYRHALRRIGDNPPEEPLLTPTTEVYSDYIRSKRIDLHTILDSPIQIYFFKKYLDNFLNVRIVVDFLVQYDQMMRNDTAEIFELENLVFFSTKLPGQYKEKVEKIQAHLRLLKESELIETEAQDDATDLSDHEQEEISLLATKHSGTEHEVEEAITEIQEDPKEQMMKKFRRGFKIRRTGANQVLSMLHVDDKDTLRTRLLPFGGAVNYLPEKDEPKKAKGSEGQVIPSQKSFIARRANRIMRFFNKPQIMSAVEFEVENKNDPFPTNEERKGDETESVVSEEHSVLESEPRIPDVKEAKETLLKLFDDLDDTLERKAMDLVESFKESREFRAMINTLWASEQTPTPESFRRFRILGKGAFGTVASVKHKATGQLTALKSMNKKLIKGKKAWSLINQEKTVLQILGDNPSSFTVWLKYAFQDRDYFYMAIPLCTGGDLSFHLKNSGTFDIDRIRFYSAEIFEGMAHLHRLGIIYRDLKPENIILDQEGHCRITDMGLAAITNGNRIKSKAGTPGYWAPEVLLKDFYSFSSDYWSLGVVIFEFFIGICPFSVANSRMDRDDATIKWRIRFPKKIYNGSKSGKDRIPFPSEAMSLLKMLLRRRPRKRATEDQFRAHPFFRDLDWDKLRQREIEPTFIPPEGEINSGSAEYMEANMHDNDYKRVKLEKKEILMRNYDYISKYPHEIDIVNMLDAKTEKDKKKVGRSRRTRKGSTASTPSVPPLRMSTKEVKLPRKTSVPNKANGCIVQ